MTVTSEAAGPEANALPPVEFELIRAEDCFGVLEKRISQATRLAVVQAMSFTYDEITKPIFDAMTASAAKDGVKTRMIADGYSLMFNDADPAWLPGSTATEARIAIAGFKDAWAQLKPAGVDTKIINRYNTIGTGILRWLPYANRNHIKGNAVDDWVTIAGLNITGDSTKRHDFVLATEHAPLARFWDEFTLAQSMKGRIAETKDFVFPIDDQNQLLVDVGNRGESGIYDTALDWLTADDVASVDYVNQFFPTGKIAESLKDLQERLGPEKVRVLTTHARQFSGPSKVLQLNRQGNTPLIFKTSTQEKPIHTKVLVVTKNNGQRVGMVTSNNLDDLGVKFGTAETALVTTNKTTLDRVMEFCQQIPSRPYR